MKFCFQIVQSTVEAISLLERLSYIFIAIIQDRCTCTMYEDICKDCRSMYLHVDMREDCRPMYLYTRTYARSKDS